MAILTQRAMMANFLISEANGYFSRDDGEVVGDGSIVLQPGTVLGRVTTGTATAAAQAGNTGNATCGTVTPTSDAIPGVYTVEFVTATTFNIYRPGGFLIGAGSTGVAVALELGFTITAGGTAMVAGDGFNITVATAPGDWRRHTLANSDGTQNAAGILLEEVPIGVTVKRTVIRRSCEVVGAHLIHSAGASASQIATAVTALAALGIIVR